MIDIETERNLSTHNVKRYGSTPIVVEYGMELRELIDKMEESEPSSEFYKDSQKADIMPYVIMPQYGENIE